KLGHSPSYIWRSFLSARELLKVGAVWRMRNGWSISIWSQTRVPQVPSFKVHSLIRIFGETSKVSKLIVEEWHCWDHKLIFEVFNRSEAINICSIPLSSKRMEDKLI
ncbi:hypothetical protein I3843_14G100300, partial [Carya illinoinensis]